MTQKSFSMQVQRGDKASLFDNRLVSSVNGETRTSYVFTIYAEPSDMNEFTQATTLEKREQFVVFQDMSDNKDIVTMVVNKVNDIGFYQTTRMQASNTRLIEQVSVPLSEAAYKHLAMVGYRGYRFERLRFPVPNTEMEWEVDIFRNKSGQRHPWVRITIEVDHLDDPVPPLPFACNDYILDFPGVVNQTQSDFIEKLYNHGWVPLDPEWVNQQVDYKEQMGWGNQTMGDAHQPLPSQLTE